MTRNTSSRSTNRSTDRNYNCHCASIKVCQTQVFKYVFT